MAAEACCVLGICCARPKQQIALGQRIKQELDAGATPDQIAAWILDNFDLWHADGLSELKAQMRDMLSSRPSA